MADIDDWSPWTPLELSHHLSGLTALWSVVGGWALDLWQGQVTRPHDDIEITTLRPDFDLFRTHLSQFDIYCAQSGQVRFLPPDEAPPPDVSQFWVFDLAAQRFRLDIMIERGTPRTWVFKRNKWIKRTRIEAQDFGYKGLPYLNPACVLLFKAKAMRPKDEIDFARVAPLLTPADREWLRGALEQAYADHPWISQL